MGGNCPLTMLVIAAVVIIIIITINKKNSSGYVLLENSVDLDQESKYKQCRCLPWHNKAVQGHQWGKKVTCPSNSLMAGTKWWCTSDGEECRHIACDYI